MRALIVAVVLSFGTVAVAVAEEAAAKGGKWESCPVPACAAPCAQDAPKDIECKSADGKATKTSFACCCCGGGGNSFKRIKPKK